MMCRKATSLAERIKSEVIGIDLGTTNSAVAIFKNGVSCAPEILTNFDDKPLTPSCVTFSNDTTENEPIVGDYAVRQKIYDQANTIYDFKRLLGMPFEFESDDMPFESDDIKKFGGAVPFKICKVDNKLMIQISHCNNKKSLLTPVELSAFVVKDLKKTAETRLNVISNVRESITRAVITVPAHSSKMQKRETLQAAELAGFIDTELMTEPAAAAFTYAFKDRRNSIYKLLVYDFGGGTFDVTLLGVNQVHIKQLAIDGDNQLGGRDINQLLQKYVADSVNKQHGIDLLADKRKAQLLLHHCVDMKEALTTNDAYELDLSNLCNIDDEFSISRKIFNDLCHILIIRSVEIVRTSLKNSNFTTEQIVEVLLVGGTSKIPLVSELLVSELGIPMRKLNRSVSPEEAVALGAAIMGGK